MKTALKFIAWLAAMATFLLLTAHFTLRHSLNTAKFKAAATGFVARATGRTADYERIDYSLFPFSLVVRNASLKEEDGARDFASVASFSVSIDFRTKEVASVTLEQPEIRIVQRPDGTFNFSDLFPAPPAEPVPGAAPAETATDAAPSAPPATAAEKAARPPPSFPPLRLVQVKDARFDFVSMDKEGREAAFTLSQVEFQLRDFAADRPFRMNGSATIGTTSTFQFECSGPALADHAGNLGAWPLAFGSRLDIRDFTDVKAFLPTGSRPFQSLWMTLNIQGALSDNLKFRLNLQTPEATEAHPVAFDVGLQADLSLPAPVAQHLLAGDPLPEALPMVPAPCELPPGSISLAGNPMAALLLQHVQATIEIAFPEIAWAQNRFEQGSATVILRDGRLTIPEAKLSAYGGTVEARGNAGLLACPLSYQLDRLVANNIAVEKALAANGLGDLFSLSGRLHLEASAAGSAVGEPGLRALIADATGRIDDLQSVGAGGSLMDQVWLQLDHPLLLKLVPRLEPKVRQAQQAASAVTTSRYDVATATLHLREGKASLSGTRLSSLGYRLDLSGAIFPFDDRMELSAHLLASPEETADLTDGKDLSAYLPYEDGGLMIPLSIRGSLQKPRVLPDFDRLLQNALSGGIAQELAPQLETLSDADKKHVQEGLKILQGLGTLFIQ